MFKNPHLISLRVVMLLAGISLLSACATPTYESLRNGVDQRGIPYWRQAAAETRFKRDKVENKEHLALLEQLDKDYGTLPDHELLQRTVTSNDMNAIVANMLWQRWHVLTQNADARFAYYYAYNLGRVRSSQVSFMTEATIFLMLGRISLSVDAARCGDNSVYPNARAQMENNPVMNSIREYIAKVSQKQLAEMVMLAVSLEEMRGERKPQAWLCKMGTRAMMQAMNDKNNVKVVPSNSSTTTNIRVIDTANFVPQYIDEAQWREERKTILASALKGATSKK